MDFDDAFISRSGRGWKFRLDQSQVPSARFDLQTSLKLKDRRGFSPVFVDDMRHEPRAAPEILVEAATRSSAQRAVNLLRACLAVVNGDLLTDLDDALAVPCKPGKPEDLSEAEYKSGLHRNIAIHNIGPAAEMAITASSARSFQYAIHKLFLSLQTVSAPIMHYHPHYSPRLYGVEAEPANHVRLANALTLAYSAIEEMQLEVRGSREKPAARPDGSWNPNTLADLRKRLKSAGIDVDEPIIWTIRGAPTRIERMKRHPKGALASWASGVVRDQEVPITDALRFASSIRSGVTTHRFVKESRSITFYDAHNVQHLARRLVMERLGQWNITDR
jgi:hypothetical protein